MEDNANANTGQEKISSLQQQVKALRIVVMVFAITMLVLLFALWRSGQTVQHFLQMLPGMKGSSSTKSDFSPDYVSTEANDQIAKSKAIILAEYKDQGTELRLVVKEILWVAPGSTFSHAVGEELSFPMTKDPGTSYGDGNLVFCEGQPNAPVHETRSYALYGDGIPGLKMRLSKFLELVEALKKEKGEAAAEKPALKKEIESRDFRTGAAKDAKDALKTAEAIVLTDNQDRGTTLQPVIKEILWVAPGVNFTHKVGEELGLPRQKEAHTFYGDGTVIFFGEFPGSPAGELEEIRSAAVYSGQITAYEMRLEEFRQLVAELPKEEAKAPTH